MASLCFFVQLPDRTPILAKGVFLCTSFGRSLFWNHSPSEWFSKYKNHVEKLHMTKGTKGYPFVDLL